MVVPTPKKIGILLPEWGAIIPGQAETKRVVHVGQFSCYFKKISFRLKFSAIFVRTF